MELITFANPNRRTTESVCFFAKLKYPNLQRIYFIDVAVEITYSREEVAREYMDSEIEVASRQLAHEELASGVPKLLISRAKANGAKERLVIDMTNGTKEMSSILYASASLIRVPNLFFLTVNVNAKEKCPKQMTGSDYAIQIVQPLEANTEIGRIGWFELLYYEDSFRQSLHGIDTTKITSAFLRDNLYNDLILAVEHRFNGRYPECVQRLATVSEALAIELCRRVKQKAKGAIDGDLPLTADKAIVWLRSNVTDRIRGGLSRDPDGIHGQIEPYLYELRHLLTCDAVLEQIRRLRSPAVHPYAEFRGEAEASVALHSMLFLFQMISESKVFIE
jgi:hypothetical protein